MCLSLSLSLSSLLKTLRESLKSSSFSRKIRIIIARLSRSNIILKYVNRTSLQTSAILYENKKFPNIYVHRPGSKKIYRPTFLLPTLTHYNSHSSSAKKKTTTLPEKKKSIPPPPALERHYTGRCISKKKAGDLDVSDPAGAAVSPACARFVPPPAAPPPPGNSIPPTHTHRESTLCARIVSRSRTRARGRHNQIPARESLADILYVCVYV